MSIENVTAAIANAIEEAGLCYPVIFENTSDETPTGVTWLRVDFLDFPDTPVTFGSNGYNEMAGLFQVTAFSPKGEGRFLAAAAIDAVKQIFKTGASYTYCGQCVSIDSANTQIGQGEQSWYSMICTVAFTSYIQR